MYNFILCF